MYKYLTPVSFVAPGVLGQVGIHGNGKLSLQSGWQAALQSIRQIHIK